MANQKTIQQGAEAIISLDNDNQILKNRIKKSYRLPILDNKLRLRRTKSESKIITKLKSIIPVPKIIKTDKDQIIMQFIDGKKLSQHLENLDYKEICKQIGESLTLIHNQDIIHGDLTTSNMIYKEDTNEKSNIINSKKSQATYNKAKKDLTDNKISDNFKIYFIDFGLGFYSKKIEDKAVDLHLLKQALEAKHYKIAEDCIKIILKNYKPNKYKLILERIPIIESRGRYKTKH